MKWTVLYLYFCGYFLALLNPAFAKAPNPFLAAIAWPGIPIFIGLVIVNEQFIKLKIDQ